MLSNMKINNYGKTSLLVSLISWTIGIAFTLLSWWAFAITYEGHKVGDPRPESFLMVVLPMVAFLAFPGAILATVLGIVALFKRQSRAKAIISIVLSVPLFLFLGMGFLAAIFGGV
jgi:hypothetical protein